MQLLGESNSGIVVGQFAASLAVLAGKRNAVVDVEDAVAAAGRPDGRRGLDAVLLGVDLAVGESAAAGEGGAGCLLLWWLASVVYVEGIVDGRGRGLTCGSASVLGKVVSGDEATSHTVIKTSPAVVGRVDNSVLEATGVSKVQVQLAVLALVGGGSARANVRLELVEAISDDL